MEPLKALHRNNNPEKEQSWRNRTILYQTILQGHSNQKQPDIGIKTNTQINGTEERAQK